jgi:hypothetical protein
LLKHYQKVKSENLFNISYSWPPVPDATQQSMLSKLNASAQAARATLGQDRWQPAIKRLS